MLTEKFVVSIHGIRVQQVRGRVVEADRSSGKGAEDQNVSADGNSEHRVVENLRSQVAHPAVGMRNRLPKFVTNFYNDFQNKDGRSINLPLVSNMVYIYRVMLLSEHD
jgi:hypothetical protein